MTQSNASYSLKSKNSKRVDEKLKKQLSLKSSSPTPSISLRSANPPSEIMVSKKQSRAASHQGHKAFASKAYRPKNLIKSPPSAKSIASSSKSKSLRLKSKSLSLVKQVSAPLSISNAFATQFEQIITEKDKQIRHLKQELRA